MSTNALLTGVIGEAVLELIERKELVASDSILKMIEKKRSFSQNRAQQQILDYAIEWIKKGM